MTLPVAFVERVDSEVVGPGFFFEANPFRGGLRYVESDGATLADYAAAAGRLAPGYRDHFQIWIGEHRIDPGLWHLTRPKPTADVFVRVRPKGKGGKNILRAVIMIAVIAAAVFFLGPASGFIAGLGLSVTGAAAVSAALIAGVTLIATLALNALIPPPGLTFNSGKDDPRYQLTGANNRYAPYSPVPRLFGKLKVFPLLAARPYTENVGKHQYLRMLLLVGWGPIRVTDLRIGNAPIGAFRNTQVEIFEGGPTGWSGNTPITLYNRRVSEQSLSLELLYNSAAPFQTTTADCVEIACDITFPYGLIEYDHDGDRDPQQVKHKFEYRVAGSGGGWTAAPLIDDDDIRVESGGVMVSKETSSEAVRHTARWKVTSGQYEVRVTRLSVAGGNPLPNGTVEVDRSYWTVLRSYSTDAPVLQEGVCLIAIRMQASEQLNGVPDTISCIAEAYLPVLTASDLDNPANYSLTQSPARAYADLLRRRGGKRYLADSRVDLTTLQSWDSDCNAAPPSGTDTARWTFNGMIEGGSVFDALRRVAAIGRASYTLKDGLYSVVRDKVQTTPVQHITPRNSWGYSGTRSFVDLPHALKVEFQNKDGEYKVDERIVYMDGYTSANATRFEVLQLFGATSSDLAFREARYHLAVGYLRPEEHRVNMDVENLRCTLGDRVQLTHDVIAVGTGFGRIEALVTSPPDTTGFILDGQVEFANNKTYQLRTRETNGDTSIRTVTPNGGTRNLIIRSEEFDQWTQINGATTVNTGGNAPDGTVTADKFVPNTTPSVAHALIRSGGVVGAGTWTFSVYAKPAGYKRVGLRAYNGTSYTLMATFDVQAGTVVNTAAGTARIEAADNGFFRCSVTATDATGYDNGWILEAIPDGFLAFDNYAGDGTSGCLFWGAQVEAGSIADYYVKTTSAAAYGGFTDTVACSAETTAGGPEVGNLFMFGESGIESLPALVKRIEPSDDLSASLTLVPYDAAVYTADTGAIPAFTSYMTSDFDRIAPSPPTVALRSDNTAADVTTTGTVIRLAVDITPPASSAIPIVGYEVRFRLDGSADWTPRGGLQPVGTTTVFIAPVIVGQIYEVAVRTKGVNGLFSTWTQAPDHTIVGNSTVPLQPTNPTLSITPTGNLASWTNPTSPDLRGVQLWQNRANSFTGAVMVGETKGGQLLHTPTYPGDLFYYWLRSVNGSGTTSAALAIGFIQTPAAGDIGGGDNYIDDPGSYADAGGWDFRGWTSINLN